MNLIERTKNVILSPKSEWTAIAAEQADIGGITTGYLLPLACIPAIAIFIGHGLVGYSVPFMGEIRGINWGLSAALQSFFGTFIGVFISAFVIDLLAPTFGSQKNFGRAIQLVVYSYTPVWIAGIFSIYPAISWLAILGLYGLYILYLGFPHTMQTPKEKVIGYLIVSIIAVVIVYVIIGAILGSIFMGIFGLRMPGGFSV